MQSSGRPEQARALTDERAAAAASPALTSVLPISVSAPQTINVGTARLTDGGRSLSPLASGNAGSAAACVRRRDAGSAVDSAPYKPEMS